MPLDARAAILLELTDGRGEQGNDDIGMVYFFDLMVLDLLQKQKSIRKSIYIIHIKYLSFTNKLVSFYTAKPNSYGLTKGKPGHIN